MTVNGHNLKVDWTLNIGTLTHLGSLLLAAFMVWHSLDAAQREFQQQLLQIKADIARYGAAQESNSRRLMRVETYLSAKDREYWNRVGVPEQPKP